LLQAFRSGASPSAPRRDRVDEDEDARDQSVERWFGLLTQRAIKRGAHCSVASFKAAIEEFMAANNDAPHPFV
jgi:hypothetical protein